MVHICMNVKIVGEIKYKVEILGKRKYNCTYQREKKSGGLGEPVRANCFPHLELNLVFFMHFALFQAFLYAFWC